jgi:polyhydroxybutyrate depolymerase
MWGKITMKITTTRVLFWKLTLAVLFVLLVATGAAATLPPFVDYTMTWQGETRYYAVYVPPSVLPNPPLLFMLHGTHFNPPPPINLNWGWQKLADKYGFVLIQPAATYDPITNTWNWNAYSFGGAFPYMSPPPDDSGFLRQLITNLIAQYNADPKRIYVAGFSTGAQMAQRVGVEISDLVAAVVPMSGPIVAQPVLPITLPGPPVAPVSVQEWHGTADVNVGPCDNAPEKINKLKLLLSTVDDSFNYWVQQNACTQLENQQPLCLNGLPNPVSTGNDATGCTNNVEVQFVWEPNVGHQEVQSNNRARWAFMAAHPKP